MADLVTRLILKSGEFDNTLDKSAEQIRSFNKRVDELGEGGVLAMLGFSSAMASVLFSTAMLKKGIDSTQITSSAFAKNMDIAKASVDSFFASMVSANYSSFISNLQNIVDKAGDLSAILKDLEIKTIFTGIESSELEREILKNMALARNTSLSNSVREKAKEQAKELLMEQSKLLEDLGNKNRDASVKLVNKLTAVQGYKGTINDNDAGILLKETNRERLEALGNDYAKVYQKLTAAENYYINSSKTNNKKLAESAKKSLDVVKKEIADFLAKEYTIIDESFDEFGKLITPKITVSGEMAKIASSFFQIPYPDMKEVRGLIKEANDIEASNYQRESRLDVVTKPLDGGLKGSIAFLENEIKNLQKELSNAVDSDTRKAIQSTIDAKASELENMKLELQPKISLPKGSIAQLESLLKNLQEKLRNATGQETRSLIVDEITGIQEQIKSMSTKAIALPEGSIAHLENEIKNLQKELSTAVDSGTRKAIQSTIDAKASELENMKLELQPIITLPEGSVLQLESLLKELQEKLRNATGQESRNLIIDEITGIQEQIKSMTTKAIILPEGSIAYLQEQLAALENDFVLAVEGSLRTSIGDQIKELKDKISELQSGGENFEMAKSDGIYESAQAINALSGAMGDFAGVADEAGAAWLNYISNLMSSISQALPALAALTTANAKAAAAGAASSVASIPIVGPVMAVSAIGSIVAALANVPKFAGGGIVPGGSLVGDRLLVGVNSGEMILNSVQQSNLFDLIAGGGNNNNNNTPVRFEIEGRTLVGILNNEIRKQNRI